MRMLGGFNLETSGTEIKLEKKSRMENVDEKRLVFETKRLERVNQMIVFHGFCLVLSSSTKNPCRMFNVIKGGESVRVGKR